MKPHGLVLAQPRYAKSKPETSFCAVAQELPVVRAAAAITALALPVVLMRNNVNADLRQHIMNVPECHVFRSEARERTNAIQVLTVNTSSAKAVLVSGLPGAAAIWMDALLRGRGADVPRAGG